MQNANGKFKRFIGFETLNRDLKIIFASNLLAAVGDGFVVFLLPLFIRNNISGTPENVGLLYSLSSLVVAITIIPGGFLADRYDRRKIMIAGWALWIPIPLMFSLATDWSQLTIPMLIYGITFSAPAVSAYILVRSRKESMSSAFTTLGSAYAIGYIFSPIMAGFLSSFLDTRYIFIATAIFYSLAALTITRISSQNPRKSNEDNSQEDNTKSTHKDSKIWKLGVVALFFAVLMFVISLVSTLVPQFQSDIYNYDQSSVQYLGSIFYLGAFLLSLAVGRIGDKFSKTTAIFFSMLLVSLSLSMFIFTGNLGFQVVSSFLRGASFPMWAYMGVIAGSMAPVAQRARWISVVQWTTRVTIIAAPYVGGVLYSHSPETPFIFTIAVVLALAVLTIFKFFRSKT